MAVKRVGDFMVPLDMFPSIPYWFTLRQALAELGEFEIKRKDQKAIPWLMLVFSAQNRLLGIVRRRSILDGLRTALLPHRLSVNHQVPYEVTTDSALYSLQSSSENIIAQLKKQVERQIIEFMTPIQVTVDYEDSALSAIHLMIDRNLIFVPVMKDGQVTGLIYAEDVLHEVLAQIV
ncbi:MAG: CBS domain-containing protein [Candidatus Zixiibacteriota bacterium]